MKQTPAGQPLIANRFRLLERRGTGGFASVDIAWDMKLRRRVAIKRIPLEVSEHDLVGISEARTAALLQEPHIVAVHDFLSTGTEALIIMENVDGPNLAELMSTCAKLLDLDTIAAILSAVAHALEYAHENQVLHLDIKPANILIDHSGNVKVTDFGLAELSHAINTNTNFSESQTREARFNVAQGGTIGYMPPEQIEGTNVDERSDLWAFAALAYHLICGTNPFFALSPEASLEQICNSPVILPTSIRDDIEYGIDEALMQALNAEPYERQASVKAFWKQLAPLLGKTATGQKNLRRLVSNRDLGALASNNFNDTCAQDDITKRPIHENNDAAKTDYFYVENNYDNFANNKSRHGRFNEYGDEEDDAKADETTEAEAYERKDKRTRNKKSRARRTEPLWHSLPSPVRFLFARVPAGVGAASFAWLITSFFVLSEASIGSAAVTTSVINTAGSSLESVLIIRIISASMLALLALFTPTYAIATLIAAFCAAIFIVGNPILAIAALIVFGSWWFFCGRRWSIDAILIMLVPLFCALGLQFLVLLLAVAFLSVWRALSLSAIAMLFSAMLVVITASPDGFGLNSLLHSSLSFGNLSELGVLTVQDGITHLFEPMLAPFASAFGNTWFWLLFILSICASTSGALLAKRNKRSAAIGGCLLATTIMLVAILLSAALNTDIYIGNVNIISDGKELLDIILILMFRQVASIIALAISCVLSVSIILAGIPSKYQQKNKMQKH
ncbi:MAG: serine/threonine protein kinase [Coriobacteriales bacterium]|jgi:serine/threonine protein kinase|nr:serine/threonine protein kinase [Coriobacteriales bacterium]